MSHEQLRLTQSKAIARRPVWRTVCYVLVVLAGLYYAFDALYYFSLGEDHSQDWVNILKAVAGLIFACTATIYLTEKQPLD